MNDETSSKSLQDKFLDGLAGNNCNIYLVNGIRLIGKLLDHDKYVLLLQGGKDSATQLVYKHAVSTVAPVSAQG